MRNPTRSAAAILSAFLSATLALCFPGCSSLPRHTQSISTEWLENKELPLSVSFEAGKKLDALSEIDVAYTLPSGEQKFMLLLRKGTVFANVIPASEITPGKLSYAIRARRGKDLLKVKSGSIKILTVSEAIDKAKQNLRNRVSFSFDPDVPYYRDSSFPLAIQDLKADSRVILATRRPGDMNYVNEFPTAVAGRYAISFPKERLAEGFTEFYLSVTERDPDLGNISVFLGQGADEASPYRLNLLSREKLEPIVLGELRAALDYKHRELASVCYDQEISARLDLGSSRFLKEIIAAAPEIRLHCRAGKGPWTEYPLTINDSLIGAVIPATDLEEGIDQLYFTLDAVTAEFPSVQAALPEKGAAAPFRLTVLDQEATRQRIVSEIRDSIKLDAPASVKETEGFAVNAKVSPAQDGFFARKASIADLDLSLRFVNSGLYSGAVRAMPRSGSSYSCAFSPGELRPGQDSYLISVNADTRGPLGRLSFDYPGSGSSSWKSVRVIGLDELRDGAIASMRSRISFPAALEATGSADATAFLRLAKPRPDSRCYLFIKRPGDAIYQMREMVRQGEGYSAIVSAAEQSSGYTLYYFLVTERDSELGLLEADFPKGGAASPLEYKLRKIAATSRTAKGK